MQEVVIVDAVRTAVGRHGGTLSAVRPDDLASIPLRALVERNKLDPAMIEEVYLGCANQAGEDNRDVARMALLLAGIPETNFRDTPAAVGFSFADPPFAPIVANWEDPVATRAAVRTAYAGIDQSVMPIWRVLARLQIGAVAARFGDSELAMTSFEETFASSPEQVYAIWRPVYRDMRKLPRFKEFVRQIGLVDYWKQYGWPDVCRSFGENDFECD